MDTATTDSFLKGETFEQFWASLQEIRSMNRETEEQHRKRAEELDRQFKETKKLVMETSRQMGLLHNSFGELAEHMVAPNILKKFNDLGFRFTRWAPNVKIMRSDKSKTITEIDILLENGDVAIAFVSQKAAILRVRSDTL